MILDDLNRPTLPYRIKWWTLASLMVVALLYAFYTERKNVYLTDAVVELTHIVDIKLDSIAEARTIEIHREFDEMLQEALGRGGSRVVDRLLRRADE